MTTTDTVTLNHEDFAIMAARPLTKACLILLLYLVFGVIIGVRTSWGGLPTRLLVAVPLSVVGLVAYNRLIYVDAGSVETTRSWGRALAALGAMPAYILGCYLVFLEGLLGGWRLLSAFSASGLAWSLAAVFLGYKIVYHTWLLTEIGERVRVKRLRIDPTLPRRTEVPHLSGQ